MQKIAVLALLLVLVSPVAALAAPAPDRTGRWDIGVNVSGATPDDEGTDGAVYVGATTSYGINSWLAVGAEAGGASFELEGDSGLFGFSRWGDAIAVPVLADVIFRVPVRDWPVVPYGVVGMGVIVWEFDEISELSARAIDIEVGTGFAMKFGAGVDWFLDENWIANLEGSYVISEADSTVTINGQTAPIEDIETDYWTLGGGAKYLFN